MRGQNIKICGWFTFFNLIYLCILKVRCYENDYLPSIEIIGNKFFNSVTGEQFFMKGIAYQPQRSLDELANSNTVFETKYIDPLADPNICLRDISYLTELDVNTIRVYSIDPTQNHDICMDALNEANIYVILDLAEPDISIVRNNPTWDITIWKRYKDVVDSMHKYSNVLGFFAGNEVTNDRTNINASPFVKAAIRDTKNYIKECNYRNIPVGYSTNDDIDTRDNLANYFICGDVIADFYGVNMYEWCGYSSYGTSGYKERTKFFEKYPVPVFFSEFGCNIVRPRPFTEVGALFGKQMSNVWSGGLAYMYFEEENNYGVVSISQKNNTVIKLPDFEYLKNEYAKVTPLGTEKSKYQRERLVQEKVEKYRCPDKGNKWHVIDTLPPTPDEEVCSCLNSLPCQLIPLENDSKYIEYFEYLCSQVDCSDIQSVGIEDKFGNYSYCSKEEKISLLLSKLYFKNDRKSSTCPLGDSNVKFNPNYYLINEPNNFCKKIQNGIITNSKSKQLLPNNSNQVSTDLSKNKISCLNDQISNKISNHEKQKSESNKIHKKGLLVFYVFLLLASIIL